MEERIRNKKKAYVEPRSSAPQPESQIPLRSYGCASSASLLCQGTGMSASSSGSAQLSLGIAGAGIRGAMKSVAHRFIHNV